MFERAGVSRGEVRRYVSPRRGAGGAAGEEGTLAESWEKFSALKALRETETAVVARAVLWAAMLRHGFKLLVEEWWHFTLEDEPYPDTYFTFPVQRLGA